MKFDKAEFMLDNVYVGLSKWSVYELCTYCE